MRTLLLKEVEVTKTSQRGTLISGRNIWSKMMMIVVKMVVVVVVEVVVVFNGHDMKISHLPISCRRWM